MSKPAAPRRAGEKEALAVATTVRGSAYKLNLVAGLIRGKKAGDALNILAFSKKAMAIDVRTVLASAIANAENNSSEEHTSELQSLMRTSYAGSCLKTQNHPTYPTLTSLPTKHSITSHINTS